MLGIIILWENPHEYYINAQNRFGDVSTFKG